MRSGYWTDPCSTSAHEKKYSKISLTYRKKRFSRPARSPLPMDVIWLFTRYLCMHSLRHETQQQQQQHCQHLQVCKTAEARDVTIADGRDLIVGQKPAHELRMQHETDPGMRSGNNTSLILTRKKDCRGLRGPRWYRRSGCSTDTWAPTHKRTSCCNSSCPKTSHSQSFKTAEACECTAGNG
jgi:hypothetical protein